MRDRAVTAPAAPVGRRGSVLASQLERATCVAKEDRTSASFLSMGQGLASQDTPSPHPRVSANRSEPLPSQSLGMPLAFPFFADGGASQAPMSPRRQISPR